MNVSFIASARSQNNNRDVSKFDRILLRLTYSIYLIYFRRAFKSPTVG